MHGRAVAQQEPTCKRNCSGRPETAHVSASGAGRCTGSSQACMNDVKHTSAEPNIRPVLPRGSPCRGAAVGGNQTAGCWGGVHSPAGLRPCWESGVGATSEGQPARRTRDAHLVPPRPRHCRSSCTQNDARHRLTGLLPLHPLSVKTFDTASDRCIESRSDPVVGRARDCPLFSSFQDRCRSFARHAAKQCKFLAILLSSLFRNASTASDALPPPCASQACS